MKKLLKRKLFTTNGCAKNFFMWEISGERGSVYEIIEEFRGHSIARTMLKGMYQNRLRAFAEFKKIITGELTRANRVPFGQSLVMNS